MIGKHANYSDMRTIRFNVYFVYMYEFLCMNNDYYSGKTADSGITLEESLKRCGGHKVTSEGLNHSLLVL